jgi:TIR domain
LNSPITASDAHYDAFISYSHSDTVWVWEWLRPRLEAAGLRICLDKRDFDVGVHSVVNMERAVAHSRHTLLVLTPAWATSEWTAFEELLTQTADPAARRRRLLPLLLQPCESPRRIAMLTHADFTQQEAWDTQIQRVIAAIRGEPHLPALGPPLSEQLPQSQAQRNEQTNLESEGDLCPYCDTFVKKGITVCLGCHAEVAYGATRQEWMSHFLVVFVFGLIIIFISLPTFLASQFSWHFSSSSWSIAIGIGVALLAGYCFAQMDDSIKRTRPPRFFRNTMI